MKIITANRLQDGAVVFLSTGGWVTNIGEAAVLSVPDAVDAGLLAANEAAARHEIVEALAIDVQLEGKRPVPTRLRERIRAFGPTVHYGEAALQRLVA